MPRGKIYNQEDFSNIVEEYKLLILEGERNIWDRADRAHKIANEYGKLKEFAEEVGENYGTLKQYSYVAKQYEKQFRYEMLSFRHHMVVAHKEDRYALLQKAVENNWTTAELQNYIQPQKLPVKTTEDTITLPDDNLDVNINEESEEAELQNVSKEDTLDTVINLLNDIHKLDNELIPGLMQNRIKFNAMFAEIFPQIAENTDSIGQMGLLNICMAPWGYIQPIFDESTQVTGFKRWEGG